MSLLPAALIDGVMYAAWLFLVAVGLTLIYGVMKILNMAHGSLYTIGAYTAITLVTQWLAGGSEPLFSYVLLIVAAVITGVVLGIIIEYGLLRHFYREEPVVLLLMTYAVFLILEDAVKLIWGVEPYVAYEPYGLLGNFTIGTLSYPNYSFVIVGAAILSGVALALFLKFTRYGKLLRAVIHDQEVSKAIGINVQRYFLYTFIVGAMLAALGGALTAPTISVAPGMGVDVIVLAFAVVVIGGLGSLPGAALGALIVGLVRSFAVHYWPEVELFSIYAVMAIVLAVRPKGLFAAAEPRKI
ncbi:ABC transporter permease subunit [Yanghanlia caeni]|uniref:Branched-chain amino acid ABC transporter permease n=1 Tax=Yanghanlia caeni TaxID=3064283 RepID=A0ABU1D275_9BURK|nr:branched-chain amino acid ABC transporter permease [Alcaligenaceae bacterium LG-2]NGR06734.1 branched-chain amino acid ABC transporter permease [bacterium SGD-2]HZH55570.1 branched-chain amino acid ABC transporter permease [Burkholderiaceae bacterium]